VTAARSRFLVGAGITLVLAGLVAGGFASSGSADAGRAFGRIDRLDPRLDGILGRDARIEVLAEGFRWSEGPVWDRAHARLLFSDVPNNVVHAWSERDGVSVYLRPSGYTGPEGGGGREPGSNGLAFDAQGRLVLCQHGASRHSSIASRASASTVPTIWCSAATARSISRTRPTA
jgi:gluconolactonase